METPSSVRRITRSQTKAALNNKKSDNDSLLRKFEDCEMSGNKSRQTNVLIDITNDSPIIGVAMETPTSSIVKKRSSRVKRTPGSGEDLLRGQVKTLLQKVEEETELLKLSIESRPPISQVLTGNFEKSPITRSLLLDFSDKSEVSTDSLQVSSVLIPINASAHGEDEEKVTEEEEVGESEEDYYDKDYEEAKDNEDGVIDELCHGISKISMNGNMAKFAGKHTRFVYNSDDEIVEEETIGSEADD